MSYSKAWTLINTLEKRLGFKLLIKTVGGQQGGGSELTEEAKALMDRYNRFRKCADRVLNELFWEFFEDRTDFL